MSTPKPRYILVPPLALAAVARTLTHGAGVRGDQEWRERVAAEGGVELFLDKAMRHIAEIRLGQDYDEETSESPLAHAICNLLFLLEWSEEDGGLLL